MAALSQVRPWRPARWWRSIGGKHNHCSHLIVPPSSLGRSILGGSIGSIFMNEAQLPIAPLFDARSQARDLLRITRTGALATLDRASGAPLTTLVAVASD